MVRSGGGHHRKRSRSRSITPDHKRSKSTREYDKDRIRRRSRSRDRARRSRSRDRKKEKKISESRVRSKPLKLKRRSRSRSRSRSKSKDKSTKKDDKKDAKVEDEPFDPTNLDKGADKDDEDEWVVTDIIEEPIIEDNGNMEEEYDYEADEDDQYSHHSNSTRSHDDSHHSSPEIGHAESEDVLTNEDNKKEGTLSNEIKEVINDIPPDKQDNSNTKDENKSSYKQDGEKTKDEVSAVMKDNLKDVVSKMKESSSLHNQKTKLLSTKHEADKLKRMSQTFNCNTRGSEELMKLTKEQIRQGVKLDKEFHELRMKHEIARHKAELEVIRAQLNYWRKRH